jgi:hypothetical protein
MAAWRPHVIHFIDPTIKYYTVPSGDITPVVQLTGGVV